MDIFYHMYHVAHHNMLLSNVRCHVLQTSASTYQVFRGTVQLICYLKSNHLWADKIFDRRTSALNNQVCHSFLV